MAIYHLSIKIISRGKGKSAVAAAAYRSGEKITNNYDGIMHDYTKKGGVVHTEIMLPERALPEYKDRSVLWNAVEQIEKNKNSQLAREIEIALPRELPAEKNIALIKEYVNQYFVSVGMCADIAIHDKDDGNPHAHIMLTMRPFETDGSWGAKAHKVNGKKVSTIDWNDKTKAEEWRSGWADCVNKFLESENVADRVDHRSYERQGVEQIPTVHLGVAAAQMEKRGIKTERGNRNREIFVNNQQLRQTHARIKKMKNWMYSQPLTNAPNMISVMNNIAVGKNLNTHWQKINNLKTRAKVLIFLQRNDIYEVSQLADKITQINEQFYDVSKKIKAAERRLDTLNNHLTYYDNYKKYRAVYEKYKSLKSTKSDAFYDKYSEQIQFYTNAKRYLDGLMNGKKTVPIESWKYEHMELTAEKFSLCEKFYRLKDETRYMELLRKSTENLMRENESKSTPTRKRNDLEL